MRKIFEKYKYFLLLFLVEVILFWVNFRSGTFLVGWDNVYPELNFAANFQRNIYAIWQEYRGLGVLDGMAHAALLSHTIFLYLLSFIFPLNFLRYFYTFLMHFVGGVGMYLLLKKLITGKDGLLALFGALFYQLNLVTVQMFFVPLEVFSTHFAFLPLLIYIIIDYLEWGRKKTLALFFLFSFLSTPQAHVPSVFLMYLFAAFVIASFFICVNKNNRIALKRGLVVVLFTIILNAFWGLPYVYTTLRASGTIVNSKINVMSTDNIVLRNKAFGDFKNVSLLRGFFLDYVDFQPEGVNDYMMKEWRNHINNPLVLLISISFALVTFYGLARIILQRQLAYYPFVILFVFPFLMLGNNIPILSLFSEAIQRFVPLFYNVFRFSFTKFSQLYAFSYTILLVYGLTGIVTVLRKERWNITVISLLFPALIVYSLPAFQGEFFYRNLRTNIPKSYFQLIDYFNKQDKSTRIATLPQPSFWGWVYYQWGARGSGFIWYGLPQPSLDGAFYPWSRENENYYWELTQALYSADRTAFEKVFNKYQIRWLVVDASLMSPFSQKAVYLDRLDGIIKQSGKFEETVVFDKIKVYKVKTSPSLNNFVFLANDLTTVSPQYKWNNSDRAYTNYGNYISSDNGSVYYPFRSLFSSRVPEDTEYKVEDKGNYFKFTVKLPQNLTSGRLVIPPIPKEEITEIDPDNFEAKTPRYPEIFLDGELIQSHTQDESEEISKTPLEQELPYIKEGVLEIRVPKILGYYSYDKTDEILNSEPRSCEELDKGVFTHEKIDIEGKQVLRLNSLNSSNCLDIEFPNLAQRFGYIVGVESRYVSGNKLLLGVINKTSQHSDIETYLPKEKEFTTSFFIIPPMEQYGLGYSLHIDNQSIGWEKTTNDLGGITVNPLPYHFLTGLKLVKVLENTQSTTVIDGLTVEHPNPGFYQININSDKTTRSDNPTLILSQSFDKGWRAYEITNNWLVDSWYMKLLIPLFAKKLDNHVLVNNWENGWRLGNQLSVVSNQSEKNKQTTGNREPTTTIAIVYLPQYLEYLGFGLLGASFLYLLLTKQKKTA